MDTQVAGKADVLESEPRLDVRITDVEHRLDAKIDGVERRLEVKISDSKTEIIKWVVGIAFAQVGLVLAVLRLFSH